MPNFISHTGQYLIKIAPGAVPATGFAGRSFALGANAFALEPLYAHQQETRFALALGAAAAAPSWYLAKAAGAAPNPWDSAHALAEQARVDLRLVPGQVYVEPDLEQSNDYPHAHAALAAGGCAYNGPDTNWPFPNQFAWHLGDTFSQLKSARDSVGSGSASVRIAILDTGYDPEHKARPETINGERQKNFVEGNSSARDPGTGGIGNQPGHGTGTIGILAGRVLQAMDRPDENTGDYLGGAPRAEVLPVRIATSVVHFYSRTMAQGIQYVVDLTRAGFIIDVVSISMGGLPSKAWAEAVNLAYEKGIVIVAAAGNNIGRLTPTFTVWPARFNRVISATGCTGDLHPYENAELLTSMQGNYGPSEKMATAIGGFTPNTPWAKLNCAGLLDGNGAGTSSATPQVAAAAALWLQKYGASLPPRDWTRVEAVRTALFGSARRELPGMSSADVFEKLGRGVLQARAALDVGVMTQYRRTLPDSVSFPFLSSLFGLGLTGPGARDMFEMEALHLLHTDKVLSDILPDAGTGVPDPKKAREFVDYVVNAPTSRASEALKKFLKSSAGFIPPAPGGPAAPSRLPGSPPQGSPPAPAQKKEEDIRLSARRLRGYAFDPSLATDFALQSINENLYVVPWEEELAPGPVGEYLEVIDHDPSSNCFYEPVDLNQKYLLAQDGLKPTEVNPKFHQQMVYAVAMTTIGNFERALGRPALWNGYRVYQEGGNELKEDTYLQRLRVYPHALRERNAYYSPQKKALLFGYFPASETRGEGRFPNGLVFTCLSHDIVAHETTHALLDGLHRRYIEPTNPDALAFHEAFADIVALFQHFTFPNIVRDQILRTGGNLRGHENLLGQLALQFGRSTRYQGALRDAIGTIDEVSGQWQPLKPDPDAYLNVSEPHARGAVLVAAVFDAFLNMYARRTEDLLRIASGGTGLLRPGRIDVDLAERLGHEAARCAGHVLTMCIRALDYCPPVDTTFGDYLRALITADYDIDLSDEQRFRVAFIDAFRRRGIYPRGLRVMSEDSLRWSPITLDESRRRMGGLLRVLTKFFTRANVVQNRRLLWETTRDFRAEVHSYAPETLAMLGLDPDPAQKVEIHTLWASQRRTPHGDRINQVFLGITQKKMVHPPDHPLGGQVAFRGGSTLVIDLDPNALERAAHPSPDDAESYGAHRRRHDDDVPGLKVRYCITKSIFDAERLKRQLEFQTRGVIPAMRATYWQDGEGLEPLGMLHRGC